MRKLFFVLVVILLLGLTACGNNQGDNSLIDQDNNIVTEQDEETNKDEIKDEVKDDTSVQQPDEDEPADEGQTEDEKQPEEEKVKAPNFTLTDGKGTEYTLSDYKGKIVFVNFWQTWCGPCEQEMPEFQKLYEKYQNEDVVILAINVQTDPREKSVSEVIDWVDERGFTFPILFDEDGSVTQDYQITAYPTNFIVDKEGYVVGYTYAMDEALMERVIEQVNDM